MSKRVLVSVRAILLSWSIMPTATAQAPIFRELGPELVEIAAHQHSTDADFDLDGGVDPAVLAYGATGATVRLAAGSSASLGRTFRLEIYGPPGAQYDFFGAFAAARTVVRIPGWGLLGIDQNSAFYMNSGTFDGAGAAVVVFQAPTSVAFEGLNLNWQAALPNLSRLTGALQTTLLRF